MKFGCFLDKLNDSLSLNEYLVMEEEYGIHFQEKA
jgi:hypothetical protein